MRISPLDLERAPRSRVQEWLRFWSETSAYQSYKAQEAEWRAGKAIERIH